MSSTATTAPRYAHADNGSRARSVLLVLASAELYGSDRAALEVARCLVKEGFEVHVLAPCTGPLVEEMRQVVEHVHVLDPIVLRRADLRPRLIIATLLRWTAAFIGLRRFARTQRFDLVHTNCATPLGGALLARWWGSPHVWQVHEIFARAIERRLFGRLFSRADVLLGASGSVATQFGSRELASKFRVAYTGARPTEAVCERVPFDRAEVPRIVCVGRISPGKGQGVLVEAIAALRDSGIPTRLDIVGGVYGRQHRFRDRLERRVRELRLEEAITFLGELRDPLPVIAASDIVVVPSVHPESFGMVVVEAMALGRPVIASGAGGPAEIISHMTDGILVAPGDPVALGEAIRELINDPVLARRLASNGRATAERFTPKNMTRAVLGAYRELTL